ncbi:transposase domain-containing protein [Xylophilus sp. ASV27]|uniref:transposase domain-containing protein n=3 Tax=Xylophilus sp. ASV27 TaxID=2795129 RepID=UPI0018ED4256|nr:transposase domain-containing protein [Xylophilus sp. ASV27]
MSLLQTTLNETLEALPANGIAELSALIDPGWIEQALQATGKASIRRRKLPAQHAVWLVIGLALFRQMPLWQVVQEMAQTLGAGDWLIRMPVSPRARKLHPELPSHWQARLIELSAGGKIRRFITSMLDLQRFAAASLAQLYRQRWEIELGFREIKQSLQQGQAVLRSKQPELVRQEVWGILIAHTLLRRWMRLMARHAGVEPTRSSFHTARHAIVGTINTVHLARAGSLPALLQRLLEQARYFVLPPRRAGRSFPREVKRSRSKFPTKKMPVSS